MPSRWTSASFALVAAIVVLSVGGNRARRLDPGRRRPEVDRPGHGDDEAEHRDRLPGPRRWAGRSGFARQRDDVPGRPSDARSDRRRARGPHRGRRRIGGPRIPPQRRSRHRPAPVPRTGWCGRHGRGRADVPADRLVVRAPRHLDPVRRDSAMAAARVRPRDPAVDPRRAQRARHPVRGDHPDPARRLDPDGDPDRGRIHRRQPVDGRPRRRRRIAERLPRPQRARGDRPAPVRGGTPHPARDRLPARRRRAGRLVRLGVRDVAGDPRHDPPAAGRDRSHHARAGGLGREAGSSRRRPRRERGPPPDGHRPGAGPDLRGRPGRPDGARQPALRRNGRALGGRHDRPPGTRRDRPVDDRWLRCPQRRCLRVGRALHRGGHGPRPG